MSLKSLSYSEYEGEPRHWKLDDCEFAQINLVVGRNATGKSRLISVASGLCKLLAGQQLEIFDSGTYRAEICIDAKTYVVSLQFANRQVVNETLDVDGVRRLTRIADGSGEIYYQKQGQSIAFQIAPTVIAIQQRRDELQHPFVADLAKWAEGCQTYLFAAAFGTTLVGLSSLNASIAQPDGPSNGELVTTYTRAFTKYTEPFDQAILRDMKALGYDLLDVGAVDMRQLGVPLALPEPIIGMFVIERDLGFKLPQMAMSQGMYRALALVVHLNVAAFDGKRTLVLVDDIGEGLDYERSIGLVDLLLRHSKEAGLQAIMTSNDRFIMNRVPLENWSLLRRQGSTVRSYTVRNSPKEFADFKYLGLSNFDLFTSEAFR